MRGTPSAVNSGRVIAISAAVRSGIGGRDSRDVPRGTSTDVRRNPPHSGIGTVPRGTSGVTGCGAPFHVEHSALSEQLARSFASCESALPARPNPGRGERRIWILTWCEESGLVGCEKSELPSAPLGRRTGTRRPNTTRQRTGTRSRVVRVSNDPTGEEVSRTAPAARRSPRHYLRGGKQRSHHTPHAAKCATRNSRGVRDRNYARTTTHDGGEEPHRSRGKRSRTFPTAG